MTLTTAEPRTPEAEPSDPPSRLTAFICANEPALEQAARSVTYNAHAGGTRNSTPEIVTFNLGGVTVQNRNLDPLVFADLLRGIALEIDTVTLEARQAQVEAEQHECWCGVKLDPDEADCGAARCMANTGQDLAGLVP